MAAFYDPDAAAACHKAGLGATITLKLGGNIDARFSPPIEATGTVTHLSDGNFTIEGPMLRGVGVAMGPTATFKIGGVEVVINSRRFQNYDRNFFRAGGIEPSERAFLAVKSSQHFRAAYAPHRRPTSSSSTRAAASCRTTSRNSPSPASPARSIRWMSESPSPRLTGRRSG